MKTIILAAGQGTRLLPLTQNKPKCLVELYNNSIINYIISAQKLNNISDVSIITGYRAEQLAGYGNHHYRNTEYAKTNMVHSLFCAEEIMNGDDDLIISYGDIVYKRGILKSLIDSQDDISVIVDTKWHDLWTLRMDDPLDDAESMIIDDKGYIIELGEKSKSLDDIQGQYIGLIKISKSAILQVKDFYHILVEKSAHDGYDVANMYMTTFLQQIIDNRFPVKAVCVSGEWLEVDSVEDLNRYHSQRSQVDKIFNGKFEI